MEQYFTLSQFNFHFFRHTKGLLQTGHIFDGKLSLLFAWVPIIGDPLTLVAGLLRVRFLDFIMLVAIGKVSRYLIVFYLMS